jgi:uncharacterized protein
MAHTGRARAEASCATHARSRTVRVCKDGVVVSPGPVMYHVTERCRLPEIWADGLRPSDPRANAPGSTNPCGIYMFADLGDLLSHHVYAEMADPVVLAVDVRGLSLHGDPDWINEQFPYPNTAWYTTENIPPARICIHARAHGGMLSSSDIAESLAILKRVRGTAPLAGSDVHGEQHWQAVARIGLYLAALTQGAKPRIALLFAILHDSCREDEADDPEHGQRAARFCDELHGAGELRVQPDDFSRLRYAVAAHSNGERTLDPTIGVCWDADRLCLPRVGVEPCSGLLSTDAGRGIRHWAVPLVYEPLGEWRSILADAVRPPLG